MHPVLFSIGKVTVYTYGLMIALAFAAGITLARFLAGRKGENPDHVSDLAFWILISAICGARVFFVATKWSFYSAHPVEILKIWEGGLVFYGGFLAAAAVAIWYLRRHDLSIPTFADMLAPAVALGHGIGRMGCLAAGCCYGRETDLPWAITFTDPASLAPLETPLHPTQIYESVGNFLIAAFLLFLLRKQMRPGAVFCVYLIVYGLFRSVVETFRADFRGGTLFGLFSPAQAIGLSAVVAGAFAMIWIYKRKPDAP